MSEKSAMDMVHWSQLDNTQRGVLAAAVISVCAERMEVCVPHVYAHLDSPKPRKARGLSIAVLWELGADWDVQEKIFKSEPRYLKVSAHSARRGVVNQSFRELIAACAERFVSTNPRKSD